MIRNLLLTVATLASLDATAGIITYNDFASFDAAVDINQTIIFDDYPGTPNAPDAEVNNYVDGSVTISTNGTGLRKSSGFGLPGIYLLHQNGGFVEFTFDAGVSAFGFEFSSIFSADEFIIDFFDSSNQLITSIPIQALVDTFQFIGFASDSGDIGSVIASDTGDFVALDNVVIGTLEDLDDNENNVPAPATLALFGLGLAGLGWSRRKKA